MEERTTFSSLGEKFKKGEIGKDEFTAFFNTFSCGLTAVKEEFKSKVEPAIYFNPDTKKLAEKSAAFMAIFDEYEKAIQNVEKALSTDDMTLFDRGFKTIVSATEKLDSLRGEIGEIMKTMSPI
jgi:hypothetical protein